MSKKRHTIKLELRNGTTTVRDYAAVGKERGTIVLVGGLYEHYSFLHKPVLDALSKEGFRAVGIGVPNDRHLEGAHDVSALIHETIASTAAHLKLENYILLLHSGASMEVLDDRINNLSISQIVLWASMGLHREGRHSLEISRAIFEFIKHLGSNLFRGLTDWRVHVHGLTSFYSFFRNINHQRTVFKLFYGQRFRKEVAELPFKVSVFHGLKDDIYPLDKQDERWLKDKGIQVYSFEGFSWGHAGMFSRRAAKQARDIAGILKQSL